MKPTHEQFNDFLAHRPLPSVAFEHDNPVEIVGGGFAGDSGNIVNVEQLGDDPMYLIELHSGRDVTIRQSLLRVVV